MAHEPCLRICVYDEISIALLRQDSSLLLFFGRTKHQVYFFSADSGADDAGNTTSLVPGTRAGLNDRSQSAYAAPAPNPVDNAIGHVRPV